MLFSATATATGNIIDTAFQELNLAICIKKEFISCETVANEVLFIVQQTEKHQVQQ